MKKILFLLALVGGTAHAAVTLEVSDFSNFYDPATVFISSSGTAGSWTETTVQSGATDFTVGNFGAGQPSGEIGNGIIKWLGETPQDWSAFSYLNLSGLALPENTTPFLNFYIEDVNMNASTLTQIDLSGFTSGLTTLSFALDASGVDLTQVVYWGFTVSDFGNPDFGFTFDTLVLTDTVIPEPSTYALIAGVATLGIVALRRRRV